MEVSTCWGDFYHPHHPQAFRNHQYLLVVVIIEVILVVLFVLIFDFFGRR